MNGKSIDDLDEKFASIKKKAEEGDAYAHYALGVLYAEGSGVAVDKAEAVKWYKRAAIAGNAEAQFCLGLCYEKGSGIAIDKVEAVKWHKLAAEAGNVNAQLILGFSYAIGGKASLSTTLRRSSGICARLKQD
jgi:TPR repeat protein